MTSMKEAMRDAGLTRDQFSDTQAQVVVTRQVRASVMDAPASHMAMKHAHLPGQYSGRRWNMDRFRTESISLGPAEPRKPKTDNSAARIREIQAGVHPGMAADKAAEMLAKFDERAIALAITRLHQPDTCSQCHMKFPAGHKSCPDC